MFFKMKVIGDNLDKVSYILSKHPDNVFERSVRNRAKIVAKFTKYTDQEVVYEGYIENDSLHFIQMCKQLNLERYLNV